MIESMFSRSAKKQIGNGDFSMFNKMTCRAFQCVFALFSAAFFVVMTVLPAQLSAQAKSKYGKACSSVLFGEYPQTEITDDILTARLTEIADSSASWSSYNLYENGNQNDFMKYADIEFEGEKYRGVTFSQYRSIYASFGDGSSDMSYQDENGYTPGIIYWFKCEPIRWNIIRKNEENGFAVLLSEKIIDSREFYHCCDNRTIDGSVIPSSDYRFSEIRAWLNGEFYDKSFAKDSKNLIIGADINNITANAESTQEKVWLLGKDEICNSDYGFESDPNTAAPSRAAAATDYAKCLGLFNDEEGSDFHPWRLRSAAGSDAVYKVDEYGVVDIDTPDSTFCGIRPAVKIDLKCIDRFSAEHECKDEIVNPTCTNQGYTVHTCTICGKSFYDSYTDEIGHVSSVPFIENVIPATCTKDGSYDMIIRCTACSTVISTEKKTVSANGHNWSEWTLTTPATVENEGVQTRECKVCGKTDSERIEKLPITEITVDANASNIKNAGDFIISVPGVCCKDLIKATGGRTKIYSSKEVAFDNKSNPVTGIRIVILTNGKITASREVVIMGDVNCDGEISVADARAALRAAVGLDSVSAAVHTAASISHSPDKPIDVGDARLILRAAVNLDSPEDWLKNT